MMKCNFLNLKLPLPEIDKNNKVYFSALVTITFGILLPQKFRHSSSYGLAPNWSLENFVFFLS